MKEEINSCSSRKLGGDASCSAVPGHHPVCDVKCPIMKVLRWQKDRAPYINRNDKTKDLVEKEAKFGCTYRWLTQKYYPFIGCLLESHWPWSKFPLESVETLTGNSVGVQLGRRKYFPLCSSLVFVELFLSSLWSANGQHSVWWGKHVILRASLLQLLMKHDFVLKSHLGHWGNRVWSRCWCSAAWRLLQGGVAQSPIKTTSAHVCHWVKAVGLERDLGGAKEGRQKAGTGNKWWVSES